MQNKTEELLESNRNEQTSVKLSVVKRNGAIVPFHGERIRKAIELAFRDTKELPQPTALSQAMAQTIERLAAIVTERALELGTKVSLFLLKGFRILLK